MANQNDSRTGSGLSDPSGIGGLTGSSGTTGGSSGFESTRGSETGTSGTGSFGASSTERVGIEHAQDTSGRARELAGNLRSRATEKVEDRLSEQKYRAADSLGNIAQQLRSAGEQFPQDNGVGRYMSQAAGQVDNLASFLNNRDVADLMDEVEQLARRQPAVFIGGAFALGVLGARFLKSSRRNLGDYQDRWSSDESRYMLDMPHDSVSRPNAPGYWPGGDRPSSGYDASRSSMEKGSYDASGSSGRSTGGTSSGMTGGSDYGRTGAGNSSSGSSTSGSRPGESGFDRPASGTSSSGFGASGSSSSSGERSSSSGFEASGGSSSSGERSSSSGFGASGSSSNTEERSSGSGFGASGTSPSSRPASSSPSSGSRPGSSSPDRSGSDSGSGAL